MCSRSPQNLEFGHFTLLFCRGRQRNVQKTYNARAELLFLLIKPIVLRRSRRRRRRRILRSLIAPSERENPVTVRKLGGAEKTTGLKRKSYSTFWQNSFGFRLHRFEFEQVLHSNSLTSHHDKTRRGLTGSTSMECGFFYPAFL